MCSCVLKQILRTLRLGLGAGGGFSYPGQGLAGGSLVQTLQGAAVFLYTLFYLLMELGCAVHLSN